MLSAFLGHNGSGNEGFLSGKEMQTSKIQLYAETGQKLSLYNHGSFEGIGN